MFEYWTTRHHPGARKPYEHATQQFQPEFLRAALQSGDYDACACWLGHGEL